MKRIGFIVNPIAGMGGAVGLKGTDGRMHKEAVKLGAKPVTPERARQFLSYVKNKDDLHVFVAPQEMGENIVKDFEVRFSVIGSFNNKLTSGDDTKRIAKEMLEKNADLLVFVGGDGTARDVYDAVHLEKPVIGVPSGVKMFSSVFAVNARAAAEIVDAFIEGDTSLVEGEVLDIDEDAFRKGKLDVRLYGYLKVLKVTQLLQLGKEPTRPSKSTRKNKKEIAAYISEHMNGDTLYLFGPGTTTKAIMDELKVEKTLLGIDAVYNGKLVGKDLNEKETLNLLRNFAKAKIVVSPIGGQGFIFGRGNLQFTPEVIKLVGKENITVVGTRSKIRKLRCLRVDTGDLKVDEMLNGYIKVVTGYNEEVLMKAL